jgi:hypothetical protein
LALLGDLGASVGRRACVEDAAPSVTALPAHALTASSTF